VSRHRLAAAALLVVCGLAGLVSGQWLGVGLAALALCASMLVGSRAATSVLVQRVTTFLAAGAGFAVGWIGASAGHEARALDRPWAAVATAALYAATLRLWLRAPEGRYFATFIVGIAALVACGETRSGWAYPAASVAYLLLALAAMRAHDEGRSPLRVLPLRSFIATAALFVLATGVAVSIAVGLLPLSEWSRDRLLASLGQPTTGLGDRMVLGSLEGMLQSDEVVARIYGPRVDYLRGVVYDHYQAGQWAPSSILGTRTVPTPTPHAGPGTVRVVIVSGSRERYFAPLGAHAVAVPEGSVIADRFGGLRAPGHAATSVQFDRDGAADFPSAEPAQDDLRMPVKLAGSLRALVVLWTHGMETPEEKIDAIASRLRSDFRYSLTYERNRGDPLLDFLNTNRQGHCEYFASAMAMLARAAGIPARVVAGYRVAERNTLGGYDVVRERNAHAWVEVHFAGKGWQTVDATPEDLLPQNQAHPTPFLSAALDVLGAFWGSARERAADLTLWHMIGALLVVIVVGLVVRRWGRRARRRNAASEPFWHTEGPPPSLSRLLDALARAGARRQASEPIESFARRLTRSEWDDARSLLLRYAALRYGGIGDGEVLLGEMDGCASRLRDGNAPGGT